MLLKLVKVCTLVNYINSLQMTNDPWKGCGLGHMTQFTLFGLQTYLWNAWNQTSQILHTGEICKMLALKWQWQSTP